MNKLQTTILITSLAILAISALPVFSVSAVSNFTVNFEQSPLFNEANFLPGGSVTRWVDVVNNTLETKTIGVKAKNYTSCSQDCLADQLNLAITDGGTNLYEDSLANFFTAGEKKLSDLAAGAAIKYYFTITFLSGAGNNYQDKQVGFDFDIGIFGQETIGGGGGGGGGYFGGDTGLIIFDENASPVVDNKIDITWETNRPATSRVIYSLQYEDHVLDLNNPPNYGYVHSTPEDPSNVINHLVSVSGLEPGVTYYYRCVSHGSFAISEEHSFTVPGVMAAETVSGPEGLAPEAIGTISGQIAASGQGGDGSVLGETAGAGVEEKEGFGQFFLASLGSLLNKTDLCLALFALIVLMAILMLLSSLNKEKENENRKKKWVLSLITTVILIILYSLLCPYYKALIIIIAVLYVLFLIAYYFIKSKNP